MKRKIAIFIITVLLTVLVACKPSGTDVSLSSSEQTGTTESIHEAPPVSDTVDTDVNAESGMIQSDTNEQTMLSKPIVYYIGKTIGEVKENFGQGFSYGSYAGSTTMSYESSKLHSF